MRFFSKRAHKGRQSPGSNRQVDHPPARPLMPGTAAPDFTLPGTPDRPVTLARLRGRPVVLVFYPADWSPVCGDQLALYNEVLPLFEAFKAHLLGISVDSIWCHRAYAEARGLKFALLSDFEPKGAISRAYGVYDENKGESRRALFVIDGAGIIRWQHLSPPDVNPGAHGILTALEAIELER